MFGGEIPEEIEMDLDPDRNVLSQTQYGTSDPCSHETAVSDCIVPGADRAMHPTQVRTFQSAKRATFCRLG